MYYDVLASRAGVRSAAGEKTEVHDRDRGYIELHAPKRDEGKGTNDEKSAYRLNIPLGTLETCRRRRPLMLNSHRGPVCVYGYTHDADGGDKRRTLDG